MARQRIVAFIVVLAAASADAAQSSGETELEVGGGWLQPISYGDLAGWATGPSIDLAWTRWGERHGLAMGFSSVFETEGELPGGPPTRHLYWNVTWRRRWMNADGRGYLHFGAGFGPLLWQPQTGYRRNDRVGTPYWHIELMGTRTLREGLDLRVGASTTPWLIFPLTVHPTVRAVWKF